ncbi:MAG: glycosyltransferase family 4 protein [Phycisphaeraceae bacterium]|nr:MAG: glycosyltransferase family 4 protein [Phycisphaeraceae bacterium]
MPSPPNAPSPAPAKVWILQPDIHHYRTPIFDALRERGHRDHAYDLTVLGGMNNGQAIGGGSRDYFVNVPRTELRPLGLAILYRWPTAVPTFRQHRPDALVMEANLRNLTAWKLLSLCRSTRVPVIGWSKVHSYSHSGRLMTALKKHFYSRFDRMICYGESSLKELTNLGYPPHRAVVANNTIDTRRIFSEGDRIARRADELLRERGFAGKKILLCVGRMDPEKRHADLLDAWPRLAALDPDLVLVLVSGGPLLDQVRARAASTDPDRILVTGRVPEGDDYAWIAASHACVYPGAVGLAINQSLAFGKPTIIADEIGADSEILVGQAHPDRQTGWRYPRGDLDALTAAVAAILRGGHEVDAVRHRARALMRDTVTLDNMVANIDAAIRAGLADARARRA